MSPEIAGVIGLLLLILLLLARMWIGAAMAIVGFFGYAYIRGFGSSLAVISQIPFLTVSNYSLSAIPLFILMGMILYHSALGGDLYETAYQWVGQFRGGLAVATILSCSLFAAITGVSSPALVTMGKVAMKEMRKYNYDDRLSTGAIVSAGTLAFLIPPSVALIIYGMLTENSIGRLFIAGFLPGILMAFLFIVAVFIITFLNPAAGPAGPKTSFRVKLTSLKGVLPIILLFIVILAGIYGGIFTPTEAGAIGVFGALVISVAMRRLSLAQYLNSLLEAAQTTAMVFLLMIGADILSKFLAISGLPVKMGMVVAELSVPPLVIFCGIILLYIVLGMFLDIISAIILTIPIIYPLILALGYDPIWFGIVMVILIQMGLITPPVGLDAFVLSGVVDVPLSDIFRGALPFLIMNIICIVIIMVFPQIVLFLANTM